MSWAGGGGGATVVGRRAVSLHFQKTVVGKNININLPRKIEQDSKV